MTERGQALLDAHKIINGERMDQYGLPEDSFADIGILWTWWLRKYLVREKEITSRDVAIMMALLKIGRHRNLGLYNNLLDACGYLGVAADLENLD